MGLSFSVGSTLLGLPMLIILEYINPGRSLKPGVIGW